MKLKIFFLALCMILLIGTISALEFDNVKFYDNESRTATIKNSFLGISSLSTSTIAEVKLLTPLNVIVPSGYQKVAEFEIRTYKDYGNALKGLEFFDQKDSMRKISRAYDFKYKTYEDVVVDDYADQCGKSLNGTSISCTKVKVGSHIEQREAWIKLTPSDFKKNDIIIIGIFTNVEAWDYVDWMPEMFGVKIPEWATWIESLNSGLVEYWNFDQSSGTTIIGSLNRYNMTSNSSTWVTGKNNNAMNFSRSSSQFARTTSNVTEIFGGNVTINGWVNVTSLSSNTASDTAGVFKFGHNDNNGANNNCMILDGVDVRVDQWLGVCPNTLPAAGPSNAGDVGNWIMLTLVYNNNTNNLTMYRNGSLATAITTTNDPNAGEFMIAKSSQGAFFFAGVMDEIGLWNRTLNTTEISYLYDGGNGTFFSAESFTISQNSPVNAFNTTNRTIVFNITPESTQTIINVSILLDGVINQTNTSAANGIPYLFYVEPISEGNHNWSATGFDTGGQASSSTRTFTIDLTDPILNITNPLNQTYTTNYTNESTQVISLNWTTTETNPSTCWYQLENNTNVTLTCGQNTTLTIPWGVRTFRVWANDSAGNYGFNRTIATYNFTILQNSVTFNNETIEGVLETFTIDFNVTSTLQVSTLDMIYGGSNYSGSFTPTGNRYNGNVSFIIPGVTTDTNKSFYFRILLNDGIVYNSSNFTQLVRNLGADNCGSFNNTIFNYTLLEEESQANLTAIRNTTIELSLSLFDSARQNAILNFSSLYNNTNPARVCLNIPLTNTTQYSVDSVVKYDAVDYEPEYYNIINFTLKNSTAPQNIKLFDLLTADSTEFKITFKDSNFQAVQNALIQIQRQYITENNTFKVVELPKTDSNGQTLGHFVELDIVYNLIVTNGTGGTILGTFENIIAFCEDPTIGDCQINLNAFSSGQNSFNYNEATGIALTDPVINQTTRLLSTSFTTFDGSTRSVNLRAYKYDQLGNTSACNSTLVSSSGTLSCTIPASLGNASVQVYVYVDGNLVIQDFKGIGNPGYGDEGYLFIFLLILTLVIMFADSKTAMILSTIFGFIFGIIVSIVQGSVIGVGASIMFLLVAAIILIWKLNKNKN